MSPQALMDGNLVEHMNQAFCVLKQTNDIQKDLA